MPHVVHDSCVVLVLRAQVRVLYSHGMYQHSYTGPPDHGHRFALNSYSLPAGCVRAEYMRYMNVQKKRQNPKRKENVKPSESRIAYASVLPGSGSCSQKEQQQHVLIWSEGSVNYSRAIETHEGRENEGRREAHFAGLSLLNKQ